MILVNENLINRYKLFKHTILNSTSLAGCRTWCPTDLQHLCCKVLINKNKIEVPLQCFLPEVNMWACFTYARTALTLSRLESNIPEVVMLHIRNAFLLLHFILNSKTENIILNSKSMSAQKPAWKSSKVWKSCYS